MSGSPRLFIACDLKAPLSEELDRLCNVLKQNIRARFVPRALRHITLAFLGETPPGKIETISNIIRKICKIHRPERNRLGSLQFFGTRKSALLWCDVHPAGTLSQISTEIRALLKNDKLYFDPKEFLAHITIARNANISAFDLARVPLRAAYANIDVITLYQSLREPSGKLFYKALFSCQAGQ